MILSFWVVANLPAPWMYVLLDRMAGRCSIVANAWEISHFEIGSSLQGQTFV